MIDPEYLKLEKMMNVKRALLRGTENLIDMGGFIGETIVGKIVTMYPVAVGKAVRKYCPIGPGYWDMAGAVHQVFIRADSYNDMRHYFSDDEYEDWQLDGASDDGFFDWLMDQTARCAYEKMIDKEDIWKNVNLPYEKEGVKSQFSPLEERLLDLSFGLSGEEKMNAIEISDLPEFSCHPFYILSVIDYARSILARYDISDENLSIGNEGLMMNKDNK